MLTTWWVWVAGAIVLGILEILVPVFLFLGFSVGALTIGILIALGVTFGSVAWQLVVFAAVSLVASVALRFMLGGKRDETKTFTDDINRG